LLWLESTETETSLGKEAMIGMKGVAITDISANEKGNVKVMAKSGKPHQKNP